MEKLKQNVQSVYLHVVVFWVILVKKNVIILILKKFKISYLLDSIWIYLILRESVILLILIRRINDIEAMSSHVIPTNI